MSREEKAKKTRRQILEEGMRDMGVSEERPLAKPVAADIMIAPLNVIKRELFQGLTFPAYRNLLLSGDEGEGAVLALGARLHGAPAGLALSRLDAGSESAELLSVAVEQAHRRRGIATRLVEETARCWRENPAAVKSLRAVYSSAAQTFEAIVRTLDAAGFSPPTPRVYILASAPDRLARARFMRMSSLC